MNVKVGISIGISEVRIVWNGGEELVVVDLLQVTEQCKIGMFIGLPHMTGHSTSKHGMLFVWLSVSISGDALW